MKNDFAFDHVGDRYVFCMICGQRCLASEATRLSADTGRGGLIVCPNDVDSIDYSVRSYHIPVEKAVPFTRINHTNLTNGTAVLNTETTTELGV